MFNLCNGIKWPPYAFSITGSILQLILPFLGQMTCEIFDFNLNLKSSTYSKAQIYSYLWQQFIVIQPAIFFCWP